MRQVLVVCVNAVRMLKPSRVAEVRDSWNTVRLWGGRPYRLSISHHPQFTQGSGALAIAHEGGEGDARVGTTRGRVDLLYEL